MLARLLLAVIVTVLPAAIARADEYSTSRFSKVGESRYVRASWRTVDSRSDGVGLRGLVKVLAIDPINGDETEGSLEVERCSRFLDGKETPLIAKGERIVLRRADRTIELFCNGEPLPQDIAKHVSLVAGLRRTHDDLDFWERTGGVIDWPVDERRLRKIIAAAEFKLSSVRSRTRAEDGEIVAYLSIPNLTPKPGRPPGPTYIAGGSFGIECRWRVADESLQRFRRRRWRLHFAKLDDPTAERTTKEYEINGIESATPDAWWVKPPEEVLLTAIELAAANDPRLGFYCVREAQDELKRAGDIAVDRVEFETDVITQLVKVKRIK